ncbi:PDZ domain-containing protein [Pseudogracilibacillus auburnensis]|uniref:PDZ domain-containing protein n=1 Tax=Pseudogracilibacillus auburnensis TaxID=1494959 RepID=A0A2V3VY72_9BACI|nr:PDZ domain-containing protein [Pseudogracilibacillus auburnensis]PXW81519.1 hypothetical protein DFR56_12113 [Pseudogracilibacillus auburnensis]
MQIDWLNEIIIAFIRFLKNPLLYWMIVSALFVNRKHTKNEMKQFGKRITPRFSEWKGTLFISLCTSLVISLLAISFGLLFTYEIILILCITIIILNFVYQYSLLSASYVIGIAYLLLFPSLATLHTSYYQILTSLTLLIGIFLVVEAILLWSVTNHHSFPERMNSKRGSIIGQYKLKKACFIPFFMLVPGETMTPIFSFWPTFPLGEETYSIVLIPFLIGFNYLVKSDVPTKIARQIAAQTALLAIIVMVFSFLSFYSQYLSLLTVIIAIIGRILIQLNVYREETRAKPMILKIEHSLKVFWVMENSPADRIGIRIGETIVKVNDQHVHSMKQLESVLHTNESRLVFHLKGNDQKERTIHSKVYANSLAQLGIIFL